MRRLGNGMPDTDFGGATGNVLVALGDGRQTIANALVVQADGKFLVAGSARDGGTEKVMLARFNSDGSPDGGFGTGGSVLNAIGDGESNKTVLAGLTLTDPVQAGPPPPGGGPAPDKTPPTLSASLTHKRFRVGRGTSAFSARKKRAPIGTTFRYTLSEAARVTIRIDRVLPGVKRGKRCLKPSKTRRGKRCSRFVRVGQLVRESPKGRSRVPFNGRIKRKALKRGRYRAVLRAADAAGNKSATRKLKFQVVR
jgi:hypothetical protein